MDPHHRITDPDPASFISSVVDKMPQKKNFPKFFCLLLYEGAFTSVFINKMSKKSQKSRNQGFLTFFASLWKDPDPYPSFDGSGRPKTYDPDPQQG